MTFFLDTDTVSYLLRGSRGIARRMSRYPPSELAMSVIAVAELRAGGAKVTSAAKLRSRIEDVLATLAVVEFTEADTLVYAEVRAHLERAGTPIGELDTLLGAHALARGATLVTNNTRHFERVPGLRVESWL